MQIGVRHRSVSNEVVDQLLGCHERIRSFVALARQIAEAPDAPSDHVASAASRVFRYFREALPLHVEDEELSLVPRLRGLSLDGDDALDRMQKEHVAHQPSLARLIALCDELSRSPASLPTVSSELGALAVDLAAQFEAHLLSEEQQLFPLINTALTAQRRSEIQAEMRQRRAGLGNAPSLPRELPRARLAKHPKNFCHSEGP